MANPQIEDGHVDIANEIVEALAKIRISGEEMQCLWVVLRKTYGWHKKEDSISLSQFSEMTGISRRNVCRAISRLVSKKTLSVVKKDTGGITTYQFNKDFETWLPVSKKTLGSVNNDQTPVSKKTHTKENYTKERKKGRKVLMADEDFWKEIRKIYTWIDIDKEIAKMKGYMLTPRGKRWRMTQQRVIEWLGRIDKPLEVPSGKSW